MTLNHVFNTTRRRNYSISKNFSKKSHIQNWKNREIQKVKSNNEVHLNHASSDYNNPKAPYILWKIGISGVSGRLKHRSMKNIFQPNRKPNPLSHFFTPQTHEIEFPSHLHVTTIFHHPSAIINYISCHNNENSLFLLLPLSLYSITSRKTRGSYRRNQFHGLHSNRIYFHQKASSRQVQGK